MNEFDLRRALAQLPKRREPGRDLWPGIATRIAAPATARRTSRWPWLALAAAALFALVLLPQSLRESGVGVVPEPATADAPARGDSRPDWPVGDTVLVGGAWNLPSWMLADPEVAAALEELESSTLALHHLIEAHPQATHLVSVLHGTYRQHRWLNRFGVGQMQNPSSQES